MNQARQCAVMTANRRNIERPAKAARIAHRMVIPPDFSFMCSFFGGCSASTGCGLSFDVAMSVAVCFCFGSSALPFPSSIVVSVLLGAVGCSMRQLLAFVVLLVVDGKGGSHGRREGCGSASLPSSIGGRCRLIGLLLASLVLFLILEKRDICTLMIGPKTSRAQAKETT